MEIKYSVHDVINICLNSKQNLFIMCVQNGSKNELLFILFVIKLSTSNTSLWEKHNTALGLPRRVNIYYVAYKVGSDGW